MANGSLDRLLHDVGVMVTSKVLHPLSLQTLLWKKFT